MKKILAYCGVVLMVIAFPLLIGLMTQRDNSSVLYEKFTIGDKSAYATFYDYEPAGTRAIKDSDQIIRSNFMGLRDMLDVEHEVKSSSYSSPTDYSLPGTYGHHAEGSARVYYQSSTPSSNEEGRGWVDSDTDVLYIADSSGTYTGVKSVGAVPTSNINMGGYRIMNLPDNPTSGTDGANKNYVDSVAGAGGTHAATHTNGADNIQTATTSRNGVMTSDHATSLQTIDRRTGGIFPAADYESGSTTDGIQEAIDAANANGGGTVFLPSGNHTIDETIIMYSNIIVEGEGWSTVVASSSSDEVEIDLTGSLGTTYGLQAASRGTTTLTMDTATEASFFSVGDLIQATHNSYENEYFTVVSGNGTTGTVTTETKSIYAIEATSVIGVVTPVENVIIRNIKFNNVVLDLDFATNTKVLYCQFDNVDNRYITMLSCYGIDIVGNSFLPTTQACVATSKTQNINVRRNVFSGCDFASYGGLMLEGVFETAIGNELKNDDTYGIYITGDYITVSGNAISSSDDVIYLGSESSSNSIIGNTSIEGVIDDDGTGNAGAGNLYRACETCTW